MINNTGHPAAKIAAMPTAASSPGLNRPAAAKIAALPKTGSPLLDPNLPPSSAIRDTKTQPRHAPGGGTQSAAGRHGWYATMTASSVMGASVPPRPAAAPDLPPAAIHGAQTTTARSGVDPIIPSQSAAGPLLALAADVLEDAERNRIANENRLRQLTRTETDSDGLERGFGLDESHPDVAKLAVIVTMLRKVEHEAELNLQRMMRKHQLGSWVKAQKGVGEKQAARLLAAIGDPYWNTLHDRPRTVSELWAFCGLHTVPAGGDQIDTDTQVAHVAARRSKGQKANWSGKAKSRAYLISVSMLKAGNRAAYDKRKAATQERVHGQPCVRCGPAGKPAETGSPWSLAHRHADALRYQAKEMLRHFWAEAKRIASGEEQIAA